MTTLQNRYPHADPRAGWTVPYVNLGDFNSSQGVSSTQIDWQAIRTFSQCVLPASRIVDHYCRRHFYQTIEYRTFLCEEEGILEMDDFSTIWRIYEYDRVVPDPADRDYAAFTSRDWGTGNVPMVYGYSFGNPKFPNLIFEEAQDYSIGGIARPSFTDARIPFQRVVDVDKVVFKKDKYYSVRATWGPPISGAEDAAGRLVLSRITPVPIRLDISVMEVGGAAVEDVGSLLVLARTAISPAWIGPNENVSVPTELAMLIDVVAATKIAVMRGLASTAELSFGPHPLSTPPQVFMVVFPDEVRAATLRMASRIFNFRPQAFETQVIPPVDVIDDYVRDLLAPYRKQRARASVI